MAANQVVLYFDKQEDALLFTLAASSVMSAEGHRSTAATQRSRLRKRFAKPVESRLKVF